MTKINECKTCNGYGRIGSNLHGGLCGVCEGTGLDINQIKSRCEYYGAEYQCNISTSDIMEYKDECASFFGKSKFKMLQRWKQTIINQSFKKGRDKERGTK